MEESRLIADALNDVVLRRRATQDWQACKATVYFRSQRWRRLLESRWSEVEIRNNEIEVEFAALGGGAAM